MLPARGVAYGFKYTKAALDALRKIDSKKVRRQIKAKIDALANDPTPPGSEVLNGVKHEGAPVHRIRSGDYRVLYVVSTNPGSIFVLDIGDRKEIYRGL